METTTTCCQLSCVGSRWPIILGYAGPELPSKGNRDDVEQDLEQASIDVTASPVAYVNRNHKLKYLPKSKCESGKGQPNCSKLANMIAITRSYGNEHIRRGFSSWRMRTTKNVSRAKNRTIHNNVTIKYSVYSAKA